MVTNRELIAAALDCLHPYRRDDGAKFGNVSSAIGSSTGRIYVRMGYLRGGAGVVHDGVPVRPGADITLNDDPELMLTKRLR